MHLLACMPIGLAGRARCGSDFLTIQHHLVQKSYDTYEKHIAGMRKHMTGWKSPHMEKLLAATQPDSVLISHIYERCAFRPYTECPGHALRHSTPSMRNPRRKLHTLRILQPWRGFLGLTLSARTFKERQPSHAETTAQACCPHVGSS